MRNPNKFTIDELQDWGVKIEINNNKWVFCRPLSNTLVLKRLKYTWLVFTGKADIVIWDNQ